MNAKRILLTALIFSMSAPVFASGTPVIDVGQMVLQQKTVDVLQSIDKDQKALLAKIEENQQILIKQNADVQRLLGLLVKQQAPLSVSKG